MKIKAFHPMTLGVMYPCEIISKHDESTMKVTFPDISKQRFIIPINHISIDGELQVDSKKLK